MKRLGNLLEHSIPWLVLGSLLVYTYAKFFEHPYAGFRADPGGHIMYVFVPQDTEPALEVNDQVMSIGALRWEEFREDYRKRIFENAQPGDVIPLTILHDGRELTIPWEFAGPNQDEINDLLINEGWLAYVFWLCGTVTVLSLRPKDERWRLLIAFNYLTAIWLTAGSGVSMYHIWGSAFLLRMTVWFCMPLYLQLHWLFPRKLTPIPTFVTVGGYVVAGILAIMELFQLLPLNLYLTGFLLAVLGSLLFLIAHFIFQADVRSDLRLLLVVGLIALLPAIAIGAVAAFIDIPGVTGIALVGLPILPIAYLYAVNRRQLGGLEIRLNRIISIYLFLFLLSVLMVPVVVLTAIQSQTPGSIIGTTIALGALAILATVFWFPAFQSFVERWLLGIRLPARDLVEEYSAHITSSSSIFDLTNFLQNRVLSTLFVRQFVFLHFENGFSKILLAMRIAEEQIPFNKEAVNLAASAGRFRLLGARDENSYPWIRLVLPLRIENKVTGLWLFGRRDPDDLYSQAEMPILQLLANQTAIALSNILQTEQIRGMNEANIQRYEQERLRLAHELHDSVLNELAVLVASDDAPVLSPKLQTAYEGVTERLREIVSDLRPPMLNFGLQLALEGLADNLMERTHDTVQIVAEIQADGDCRYPEPVEIHLYRIAQEACQNSLRYAHAKTIRILSTFTATAIEIAVIDDGIGFVTETRLKLDEMLANKHFGLANMLERANLIGAEIEIASRPGSGTQLQVKWAAK
jgi:signal transduction histidine kinase